MSIKQKIKELLNWSLYHGQNKIDHIGENVALPYDIRVSGGGKISIGNLTCPDLGLQE